MAIAFVFRAKHGKTLGHPVCNQDNQGLSEKKALSGFIFKG